LFFKKWRYTQYHNRDCAGETLFHAGNYVSLRSVNPVKKKILIETGSCSGGDSTDYRIQCDQEETLFLKKDTRATQSRPFAWDIRANQELVRDFTYSMKDTFRAIDNNPSSIDYHNKELKDQ
jgi:hypothetical protein